MFDRSVYLVAVLAITPSAACKDKPSHAAEQQAHADYQETERVSRRTQIRVVRPLLDEVSRAELDAGGILIDLGSPDQHKYTRGGWRTGWGTTGADDHATWIVLDGKQGFLELPAPTSSPAAIVFRARSKVADQKLSCMLGGRDLGTASVGKDWTVNRISLPAGALPDRGAVRLELRAAKGSKSRADIDWVWLARGDGQPELAPRIQSLEIAGTTRRSLAAPTARTYAFYLEAPAKSELVVDLGAADHARFTITAVTDDGNRTELMNETIEKGWQERAISLASLAGKAVRLELATADQRGAAGWGEPEIGIDDAAPKALAHAGKAPKNVIFILMDTMRADSFAPFAHSDRVVQTPSYDELATRSTVFTSAYDNENWTKPSVATSLTGLYPSTHGTKQDASKLPSEVEMLSEHLKGAGFTTAGFVANGYISNAFGFEQGWDTFKNYIRDSKPSESEHVFGDALAWHAEHEKQHPDKPYFLYLQTIDPHVPYRVDREYWSKYFDGDYSGPLGSAIEAEDQVKLSSKKLHATDRDLKWLHALYWGEVSYHDAQLGAFIKELEARHVLDDTLIVITNDHGEELGERGRFGHGHQVFEELIRAPLLIHYPAMFDAGQVPDIVEQVDLAPTILDVLGKPPLRDADGISFLPLVEGHPVQQPAYAMTEFLQNRRVLRVGHWKLFGQPAGGGSLFDLASDPEEHHALEDTAPVSRRLCEIHLGEALAVPAKVKRLRSMTGRRQFRAGEAKISSSMRRQLEALGYVGAGSAKENDAE